MADKAEKSVEKTMNIYQKLIEVRKIVPYLKKENEGYQFSYVSSSQVLAAIKHKMDECGLLLVPKVLNHNMIPKSTVVSQDQKTSVTTTNVKEYMTEVDIEFTWINADNPSETIVSTWYGQGIDTGEKGVGKSLTYAEKYYMLKFFNIPTDKDDPDSFQDKIKHTEQPQPQPPPPPKPQPVTLQSIQPASTKESSQSPELEKRATAIFFKLTGNKEGQLGWGKDEYNSFLKALKETGKISTAYGKKWTEDDCQAIETVIQEMVSDLPF